MGTQRRVEVKGNVVVGNGATGHGEHFAVAVFVAKGLEGFPDEVFLDGHVLGLGSSNHQNDRWFRTLFYYCVVSPVCGRAEKTGGNAVESSYATFFFWSGRLVTTSSSDRECGEIGYKDLGVIFSAMVSLLLKESKALIFLGFPRFFPLSVTATRKSAKSASRKVLKHTPALQRVIP
jgi:hypothetical protein